MLKQHRLFKFITSCSLKIILLWGIEEIHCVTGSIGVSSEIGATCIFLYLVRSKHGEMNIQSTKINVCVLVYGRMDIL
jgi:hypothetical protein